MKTINFVFMFIILSCLADPAFSQGAAAAETKAEKTQLSQEWVETEYKIASGNILRVDMYNGKGEKLSQTVRVSSDGVISLPFVGELNAAGLTVTQLQRELKQRLVKNDFVSSNALVFVEEFSKVTIVGEVNRSGDYPIKGRLTIVELVAMAGGFSEFASTEEVKIIRLNPDGTKTKIVVGLYEVMNNGSTENEGFLLSPNDVVIVPRSVVSIMGEVNKPGIYPTRGRMTPIELISMAGGFSKFASPNEVKVTHSNPDGTKTRSVVRVKDILHKGSGENEELLLEEGDVVYVPAGIY